MTNENQHHTRTSAKKPQNQKSENNFFKRAKCELELLDVS